ncbi:MAG: SDR family NAD(P)-dependent oxidoreductase, partial [Candidatus Helarchaeota archaeon]
MRYVFMDLNLKGKTAIVTGGASGIGRQACLDFADEGANVVIADINEEGAKQVAQEINKKGGTALPVKCDVTKTDDVKAT